MYIQIDGDEVAESINDDSLAKDPSGDNQDVIKLKEGGRQLSQVAEFFSPDEDDLLVDIALTVSSSFDWVVAGAKEAGAEIRCVYVCRYI
jgi:hypothetical protein